MPIEQAKQPRNLIAIASQSRVPLPCSAHFYLHFNNFLMAVDNFGFWCYLFLASLVAIRNQIIMLGYFFFILRKEGRYALNPYCIYL